MGEWVRKIFHLPGTRLTPDVVLARTMTKNEHIKAVVVLIQWDDDSWDYDWSQMQVRDLAMASMRFQAIASAIVNGNAEPIHG